MSLLILLGLLAAQSASPSPAQPVSPAAAQAKDDRIDRAAELMRDGKQAAAIAILDTKIAEFEKAHPANSETMVFSASNLSQTIYYSGLSAALKKSGVVLDADWGFAYFLKGFALIDLMMLSPTSTRRSRCRLAMLNFSPNAANGTKHTNSGTKRSPTSRQPRTPRPSRTSQKRRSIRPGAFAAWPMCSSRSTTSMGQRSFTSSRSRLSRAMRAR
jgi:hypothetical protein